MTYLSPENVCLSLFDDDLGNIHKGKIARKMLEDKTRGDRIVKPCPIPVEGKYILTV